MASPCVGRDLAFGKPHAGRRRGVTLALVRRAGLIAAVVGVVVLAGLGAWLMLFRDTAEPVTVEDAITSFRMEPEGSASASPIPPGVYVYGTDGSESTDALTGVTHRYPNRSTIIVAAADCGVSLAWRVLKGRSTEWRLCQTDGGWQLRAQDERHTFYGQTERTTYICEDTPILPARHPLGASWPVECATDGATETGMARIVARRPWQPVAGGRSRASVLVRKVTTFGGDIRGFARYAFWFDEVTGLPVRLDMASRTSNESPVGDVHYREDVVLRLLSLEPRR